MNSKLKMHLKTDSTLYITIVFGISSLFCYEQNKRLDFYIYTAKRAAKAVGNLVSLISFTTSGAIL